MLSAFQKGQEVCKFLVMSAINVADRLHGIATSSVVCVQLFQVGVALSIDLHIYIHACIASGSFVNKLHWIA